MVIDSKEGNLLEISKLDGSLHRYLAQIHKQYGRIVAFFMGKQLVVSLSDFDKVQEHIKYAETERTDGQTISRTKRSNALTDGRTDLIMGGDGVGVALG